MKETMRERQMSNMPTSERNGEDMIRVNGRQQIIDMLRVADPAFREIILRNIERRDPRLARELKASL